MHILPTSNFHPLVSSFRQSDAFWCSMIEVCIAQLEDNHAISQCLVLVAFYSLLLSDSSSIRWPSSSAFLGDVSYFWVSTLIEGLGQRAAPWASGFWRWQDQPWRETGVPTSNSSVNHWTELSPILSWCSSSACFHLSVFQPSDSAIGLTIGASFDFAALSFAFQFL